MKNFEAYFQLIAELEQDYEYIQESTRKNHQMYQRIRTNQEPDDLGY